MHDLAIKFSRNQCTQKGRGPMLCDGNFPQECYSSMQGRQEGSTYITEAEISDRSINGVRGFSVSFMFPAVSGDGVVKFSTNYAAKLIKEFVLILPTEDEYKIDRDTIISNINYLRSTNKVNYDIALGNEENRFIKKKGLNTKDTIHKFIQVTVKIPTVFDIGNSNYFPTWRDKNVANLRVRVVFDSIDKVIIYQKSANFNFYDVPIFPDNITLQYEAIHGPYSIDKSIYMPFVTEIRDEVMFEKNHVKNITVSDFNSISNISFFERPPVTSSNTVELVSLPDGEKPTPSDYMNTFVSSILGDLVVFATRKELERRFPDLSVFIPIKDCRVESRNADTLWSINCRVYIENLPENSDKELFYHANLFSYKGYDTTNPPLAPTNVSNYFSFISGTYLQQEGRIEFRKSEHSLPDYLPALSVTAWRSNHNCVDFSSVPADEKTFIVHNDKRSIGDKRSFRSRAKDLVFNDPELIGVGFSGRNMLRISALEVCKQVKYDEESIERMHRTPGPVNSDPLLSTLPVAMLGNNYWNTPYNVSFNTNSCVREEPTRLTAKKDCDQKDITYRISPPNLPQNDPRKEYISCTFVQKNSVFKLYTYSSGKLVLAEQDSPDFKSLLKK